jgi:hypothetical protein
MNKTDKNPLTPPFTAPNDTAELDAPDPHIAELDALGAEIAGTEGELSAAQAAASAAAFKAKAESWAFIPAMFGKIVAMALPELKDVYTEDACFAWGEAMVPVAEKYGWGDPAVSVEVALIIATVPLALPTGIAIKKYLDLRKQQASNLQHGPAQVANSGNSAAQASDSAAPREAPSASHILPAGLFAGEVLKPTNKQPA